MEESIIAAIIAASVAALTSIASICLSIHRNKQDGVTAYRMQWINDIRTEYSSILGWDIYAQDCNGNVIMHSINELGKSVYKISLLLNTRDSYDKKILDKTFEYYKSIKKSYECMFISTNLNKPDEKFLLAWQSCLAKNQSDVLKEELLILIRVYLKTEWTRVKVDSSVIKWKYLYCWKPVIGFQAQKAIDKYTKEYMK